MAPQSKRGLRPSSPISSWTYSTKPLSAVELAADRSEKTRHRSDSNRQGTRCITVDVSQSERDALVVRGYLPEEERENGAAIKKGIEAVLSDIELDLQYETAERSRTRG